MVKFSVLLINPLLDQEENFLNWKLALAFLYVKIVTLRDG